MSNSASADLLPMEPPDLHLITVNTAEHTSNETQSTPFGMEKNFYSFVARKTIWRWKSKTSSLNRGRQFLGI